MFFWCCGQVKVPWCLLFIGQANCTSWGNAISSKAKAPRCLLWLWETFFFYKLIFFYVVSLTDLNLAGVKEFWPTEIFQELCYLGTRELYNMRFYHTYIDEDMIGTMKGLCRRVHRRMLELRVLLRWMIRLKTHVIKAPRWFGKKSWSEHMCLGWGFGWFSEGIDLCSCFLGT